MSDKQPRVPYTKDTPKADRLPSSILDTLRVHGWKMSTSASLINTYQRNGVIVSIQSTSRLGKNYHLVISKNNGVDIRLLTQSEVSDYLRQEN